MAHHLLIGIALILALGIAGEWLAWRIRFPSILLLLALGLLAGPLTGILDPDALLGDVLFPLVSIAVAIILFEGGLSLRLAELREIGHAVRNLVTIGVLITWVLTSVAGYYVLGLGPSLAALQGAILVVTGPTVIIPLLRHIQPTGRLGPTLKWEGILNDPIGAVLAVLVFEAILAGGLQQAASVALMGLLRAALIGVVFAAVAATFLIQVLKRHWVPDFLQSPVSLMVVVSAYTASNLFQTESGLLTATLMGVIMANQKKAVIRHIIEFKENLRVLLISTLFILLAARIPVQDLARIDWRYFAFLGILMFVVRPAAVFASTVGSALEPRQRLFLAWLAPRGIVAALVASLFSLELAGAGVAGADQLVPITFLVIMGTVAIYGLSSEPLARWLKVASPDPQGLLIVGAHRWGREIGRLLQEEGYRIRLLDSNQANIAAARMAGLDTYHGSALTEYALEEIDLEGIGRMLALTPNDEVNSLTALHFSDILGRTAVYQLPPPEPEPESAARSTVPEHLRGRLLFDPHATYRYLDARFKRGAILKKMSLTASFDYDDVQARYDEPVPLFVIDESGQLIIVTGDSAVTPRPGQTLIALVDPAPEDAETARQRPAHGREGSVAAEGD